MSAKLLREAAVLIRARAEAVDTSTAIHDDRLSFTWEEQIGALIVDPDATHLASWHPVVALAVADLLERALDIHSEGGPLELVLHYDSDEECSVCEMGGHEVPVCNGCYPSYEGMDGHSVWPCVEFNAALTVARAYLGRAS